MRRVGHTSIRRGLQRNQATQPPSRAPKSAASWFYTGGSELPMQMSSSAQTVATRTPTVAVAVDDAPAAADGLVPADGSTADAGGVGTLSGRKQAQMTELERFVHEVQMQEEAKRLEENSTLPLPRHPDEMVPEFRRIKRHAKHILVLPDPDRPTFERKDQFVPLPPAGKHPWVEDTPHGPHIVHGDGQLGVVGTGEVGFDTNHVTEPLPRTWRGLQYRSLVGRSVPDNNGRVLDGHTEVKHSLSLTGRGVFATRDVKKNEVIMVVASTAQSLGLSGEQRRLVDMCVDILKNAHEGRAEDRDFLHDWIMNGQLSSLVERWPERLTKEVLERIGGDEVLRDLELHPLHIARLAGVIDMNSFVVESTFDERRGMAYWPEAGLMNHSCEPNATYEIVPDHAFKDSEFFADEAVRHEEEATSTASADDEVGAGVRQSASKAQPSDDTKAHHEERPAIPADDAASASPSCSTCVASSSSSSDVMKYADVDLTASGAPTYLFCARATKDIAAGEEILISYVPVDWSFDARQYVLHDRYRFRCKCPRCAPTIDSKYARLPKFMLLVMCFLVTMQMWLFHMKYKALHTDDDGVDPEPERPQRLNVLKMMQGARREGLEQSNYDMGFERGKTPFQLYANDPMAKAAR